MLVSLGDREADIYELFQRALDAPAGPRLLVRAEQDRLLSEGQAHLWEHLEDQPVGGSQWVQVPRPARVRPVRLSSSCAGQRPAGSSPSQAELKPLSLWAVLAQETEAPPANTTLVLAAADHLSGHQLSAGHRKVGLVHGPLEH